MIQYTTPEQTAKLIELGVAPPAIYVRYSPDGGCWADYTLGELISFCPTTINVGDNEFATFEVYWDSIGWRADYHIFGHIYHLAMATELIDCLFEMVVKLKEEGVI